MNKINRKPFLSTRAALIFALIFPTILTYTYFVLLKEQSAILQKSIYGVGKLIQFGLPISFTYFVLKEKILIKRPILKDLFLGFAFGILIFSLMILLYEVWLLNSSILPSLIDSVNQKINELNLTSRLAFILIGLFYSLFHSFLEEYYWRWFVFKKFNLYLSERNANIISSLGFMSHHVILLGIFFGFQSPITYLFSLFVAVGGSYWAYIYKKSNSLYGAWIGHALVDAGIFYIGFKLVF